MINEWFEVQNRMKASSREQLSSIFHIKRMLKMISLKTTSRQIEAFLKLVFRSTYGFHNLDYEYDNHSDNDKKINNLFSNISLCQS